MKTSEGANCSALDNYTMLSVSSLVKHKEENYLDLLCYDESDEEVKELNEYTINVLEYVSDFVVKRTLSTIRSDLCSFAVQDDRRLPINLLDIKKPSKDVVSLCKIGELIFKMYKEQLPTYNSIEFLIIKASSKIDIKNNLTVLKPIF